MAAAVPTMQVPQEIVDAIIDNFAMSDDEKILLNSHRGWRESDGCTLTQGLFIDLPFVSTQEPIALVLCDLLPIPLGLFEPRPPPRRISTHRRTLRQIFHAEIGQRTHMAPLLAEDVVLPRILDWPSPLKASIQATLSLHCLRSLCLHGIRFANASELELLLSNATGLKALTLCSIHFDNPSARPPQVRIFLESLELELEMESVNAIVSGFSTIDIKHLKSLVTKYSPIIPLLKVNAQTIQKIRASFCWHSMEPPDPDILKGNQTLHTIEITEYGSVVASILQQFGHLGHLRALKTISLDFADEVKDDSSNAADWTKLDAILSSAVDGLEDIHIHTEHPLGVEFIRSLLPSVGEKIAVHVHQKLPQVEEEL
ncbi:hypothetical protein C8J57DRAFT_1617944 [Mycena rebaudengoi]|nr:hypothetical protein C8J57DRAFT_1617944 [Mycena rebaudengoi]